MLTDSLALGLAAFAERHAHRRRNGNPAGHEHHGEHLAEITAALVNSLFMAAVVAWIIYEAIERLHAPRSVDGMVVTVVAFVGIAVNLAVARIISHGAHTLNTRAALLHVFGDLAGSVVALLSGIVIDMTGWLPIDPILSLVVAALIGFATFNLLREALMALHIRRKVR